MFFIACSHNRDDTRTQHPRAVAKASSGAVIPPCADLPCCRLCTFLRFCANVHDSEHFTMILVHVNMDMPWALALEGTIILNYFIVAYQASPSLLTDLQVFFV